MPISKNHRAINIGCGGTFCEHWTNLDNSPNALFSRIPGLRTALFKVGLLSQRHYAVRWPKKVIFWELRWGFLPFRGESFDFAYSSHCLEHLSRSNALKISRETHRILKPGGVFRVVVPDLNFHVQEYLSMRAGEKKDMAADHFLREMRLAAPEHRDPHLWMYDACSLGQLLTEAGFRDVRECKFREGSVPDLNVLDARPDNSLLMEARKA